MTQKKDVTNQKKVTTEDGTRQIKKARNCCLILGARKGVNAPDTTGKKEKENEKKKVGEKK